MSCRDCPLIEKGRWQMRLDAVSVYLHVYRCMCTCKAYISKLLSFYSARVGVTRTSVLAMRISVYYPTKSLDIYSLLTVRANNFYEAKITYFLLKF